MKTKGFFKNASGWFHANYHWAVATVLVLMIFVHGGAGNNLNTLHLVPISEHLSITRADFTLVFSSTKTFTSMLVTFFSGFIISRYGCRVTAALGLILCGMGYAVLANVENMALLAVGGGLIGLSYGFCATSGASAMVRLWFHRHEGTVLGLVSAASGIGGSVLCIFQTAVMEARSFRSSLELCAALLFVSAVLVFLVVRNHPEDIGLLPLGEGERVKKKKVPAKISEYEGLPMERLWKQPAFYLMNFCTLLSGFCVYMAFNVVRNFLIDCGFSAAQSSGLYSAMMLLLTGVKFLVGLCSDVLGAKKVNLICVACAAVSLLLLSMVQSFAVAAVAVILFTFALPITTIMSPLVAFNLLGYRAQAQYTGMLVAVISLSQFFANYVTNLIYDIFGSYRPSFLLASALSVVCFCLFLLLYRMADRLKVRTKSAVNKIS